MDSGSRSESPAEIDFSVIRTAIDMGHKTIDQILNGIHYGSEEVRGLLRQECDFIFECKVCRNMFRSFPNFVAHKRVYCQELAEEKARREKEAVVDVEEETVIVQPEDCHDTVTATETAEKQADVIDKVINRTFEGKSKEYQFYTNVAEKVEMKKVAKVTNVVTLTRMEATSNAVQVGRGKLSDIELIGKKSSPKKNSPKKSVDSVKANSISPKGTSPKKKKNIFDVCAGLVEKRSNETLVSSALPSTGLVEKRSNETLVSSALPSTGLIEKRSNETVSSPALPCAALPSDSGEKRAKPLRSRKSSPRKSVDSFIGFKEKINDIPTHSSTEHDDSKQEQMDVSENEMIQEDPDDDSSISNAMETSWPQFCDFDNLKCKKCDKKFPSICHLKVHGKRKHGANYAEYKCPTCDKPFLYITSLIRHMRRTHHAPEPSVLALKAKLQARGRMVNQGHTMNSSSSQDESPDKKSGKGRSNREGWKKCDKCEKVLKVRSLYRHTPQCSGIKDKHLPKKKDLTEHKDSDDGKKVDTKNGKDVSSTDTSSRPSGKRANSEDMLMKLTERLLAPVLPMTRKEGAKEKTLPSTGEKGKMTTASNKSPYGTRHASEQKPCKSVNADAKSVLYKTLTENLNSTENTSKPNKITGTTPKETIVYVYPPSKSKVVSSNSEANKYVTLAKDCSSPLKLPKQGAVVGVNADADNVVEEAHGMNTAQVDIKKPSTQTKKAFTGITSHSEDRKGKLVGQKEADQTGNDGSRVHGTRHSEKMNDSPIKDNVSQSSRASRKSVERNTNSEKIDSVKTYETRHSAKCEAENSEKPTRSYDKLSREIAFKELEERLTAEATGAIKTPEKEPDNSKGKNTEKVRAAISKSGEKTKSNTADKTPKMSRDRPITPSPMYSSSYSSPARMERLTYYSYPGSPMSVHSNSGDAYNSKFKMTVKEMAELVEGTSLMKFARDRKKKASKILNQKSEKEKSGSVVRKPLKKVAARKVYSTRLSTGSKTDTNEQSMESIEDGSVVQSPENLSDQKSGKKSENLASENEIDTSGNIVKPTNEIDKSEKREHSHDSKDTRERKINKNESEKSPSSSRVSRSRFRERKGDSRSSSSHSEVERAEGSTQKARSSNSFSDESMMEKLVENKRLFREMARLESSTGFLQSKRHASTPGDTTEEQVDKKLKQDRDSSVSSRDSSREKRSESGKRERTSKAKSGLESGSSDDKLDTSRDENRTATIKEHFKGKETDKSIEHIQLTREQKRLSSSTGFIQSKNFLDTSSSRESSGERSRSLKRSVDAAKTSKVKLDDDKTTPVIVTEDNVSTDTKRNTAKPDKSTGKTLEDSPIFPKENKGNTVDSSAKVEKSTGKTTENSDKNISIDTKRPARQSVGNEAMTQVHKEKKQELENIAQMVNDDTGDQDKLLSGSQVTVSAGNFENTNKNTESASESHPHRTRLSTGSIYFDSELLKTSPSKFDKSPSKYDKDETRQTENIEKHKIEKGNALLGVKKRLNLSDTKSSSLLETNKQRTQRFSLETGVKQCQKCSKKFWKTKSYSMHIKSCARKVTPNPTQMSPSTSANEKMNRKSGENKEIKSSNKSADGNKTREDGKIQRPSAVVKMSDSKKRPIDSDSGTGTGDTKKPKLIENENSQPSGSGHGSDSESRKNLPQDKLDMARKSTDLKEGSVPLEVDKSRKSELSKDEVTSKCDEERTNIKMKEKSDDSSIMDTKCVDEPQPSTSKEMSDDSCSDFSGFSEEDIDDIADLDSNISDFSDEESEEMKDDVDDKTALAEDDSIKSDDRSDDKLAKSLNKKDDTQENITGKHAVKEQDMPVEKTKNVKNRVYVVDCKNPSKLHCYNNSNVDKLIDEKNLKCRQCDTPCTSISNLRRHVIRHLGWKRYKCQLCAFTCYDMSECRMHLNRSHGEKLTSKNFPRLVCDLQKQATIKRSLKRMNTLRSKKALAKGEQEDAYRKPRHSMIGKTSDSATGDDKPQRNDSVDSVGETGNDSQMFQGKHVYAQAGKSHGKVLEVSEISPKKSERLQSSSESDKEHKSDSGLSDSGRSSNSKDKQKSDSGLGDSGRSSNSKDKDGDNYLNKARLTLAKALKK